MQSLSSATPPPSPFSTVGTPPSSFSSVPVSSATTVSLPTPEPEKPSRGGSVVLWVILFLLALAAALTFLGLWLKKKTPCPDCPLCPVCPPCPSPAPTPFPTPSPSPYPPSPTPVPSQAFAIRQIKRSSQSPTRVYIVPSMDVSLLPNLHVGRDYVTVFGTGYDWLDDGTYLIVSLSPLGIGIDVPASSESIGLGKSPESARRAYFTISPAARTPSSESAPSSTFSLENEDQPSYLQSSSLTD